jgi:hypothetical protein
MQISDRRAAVTRVTFATGSGPGRTGHSKQPAGLIYQNMKTSGHSRHNTEYLCKISAAMLHCSADTSSKSFTPRQQQSAVRLDVIA